MKFQKLGWGAAIPLLLQFCVADLQAQVVVSRVSVKTRLVSFYLEQEMKLAEAIARKDITAIENLVDERFDRTSADNPEPDLRQQWIEKSLAQKISDISFEAISAREYGGFKIVNAIVQKKRGKKSSNIFIIDVWKQSGELAVLMTRYEVPLAQEAAKPLPKF